MPAAAELSRPEVIALRGEHMRRLGLERGSGVAIVGDEGRRLLAPEHARTKSGEKITIAAIDPEKNLVMLAKGRTTSGWIDPTWLTKADDAY